MTHKPFREGIDNPRYAYLADAIDKVLEKHRNIAQQRINKAIASHHSKTTIVGSAKAIASSGNATQQAIELVIVPFNVVNGNGQGIDVSEKENILNTITGQAITANFRDGRLYGHTGAKAIGTILEADDNGDRIIARGVIWRDDTTDELIDYIKTKGTIGSSFEVFYGRKVMKGNAEWLYDVSFYRQTLVNAPAYGDQTPAKLV